MFREIIGCIFIAIGLIGYIFAVIGNFKFKDMLKRMHAAGIADAFACASFVIGCIILNGFNLTSLKLFIAGVVLYFTSPVSSHMLAKLEADANDKLEECCEVEE